MVMIVTRSKLVPDFALSLYLIYLVLVFFFTGSLPRHMMWWLTMAASSALATGLGMWGCRYRELRPISFGGGGGSGGQGAGENSSGAGLAGQDGDEEQNKTKKKKKKRKRDKKRDYEMVKMNGDADRRPD